VSSHWQVAEGLQAGTNKRKHTMSTTSSTLIQGGLVLRTSGSSYSHPRADLLIDGGRITAIEAPCSIAPERADKLIDA
jgi:hypothetical protein